ncbi:MAG: hypothetical protein F4087_05705 [Gemmatimonadetes bacterium]|nr:hypothetical protein [Gemmatimonadota bacterium]
MRLPSVHFSEEQEAMGDSRKRNLPPRTITLLATVSAVALAIGPLASFSPTETEDGPTEAWIAMTAHLRVN